MVAEKIGLSLFVWKIFYVNKVDIDGSLMCMFALGERRWLFKICMQDAYVLLKCGLAERWFGVDVGKDGW